MTKIMLFQKGVLIIDMTKKLPDEMVPFSINLPFSIHSKLQKIKFSYSYYFTKEEKIKDDLIFWSFERNL